MNNVVDLRKLTIPLLINDSIKKFPENIALSFVSGSGYTYTQLGEEIDRVQKQLRLLGIDKGDKVSILSINNPNWGVAYLAILGMGAVAVPLLPDFNPKELKNILEHSEAKAIFCSDALMYKVTGEQAIEIPIFMKLDDFSVVHAAKIESVRPGVSLADVEPDDLASIIYTSGTTGRSKGVMLSQNNLAYDSVLCQRIQYIGPNDRMLSVLPLSHAYENTLGLILPLSGGGAVYYPGKPATASVLLPALKKVRPTIMLTVPLIIEKIFRSSILPTLTKNKVVASLYKVAPIRKILHKVAGKKLYATFGGELKFFGIGGSRVDPQVEKFLYEGGFPYAIGYGLTETSPMICGFGPKDARLYSAGTKVDDMELIIHDPNPVTGEGEIWTRGPVVMQGYYKEPELTKEVITKDGWFRTGDIGIFDKKNVLFIKGRIKNVIIGSSGENIYPEEIESVINSNAFVTESLVVEENGKLVAKVHLNVDKFRAQYQEMIDRSSNTMQEKMDEMLAELQVFVNDHVSKFSRLSKMVLQEVPFERTATQKIKRYLYM